MNKLILLTTLAFILGFCVVVPAQPPGALPGTTDKSLESNDVKARSIELERIRQDLNRDNLQSGDYRQLNFPEIKKDFEQMQLVFDSRVVKTYRSTDPINYKGISEGAEEVRDRAARLKSNLFFEKTKKERTASIPDDFGQRQETVKKLIVNLNDALRSLVSNPIFRNPKVIDPKDSETAKTDLDRIILLSSRLSQAGNK